MSMSGYDRTLKAEDRKQYWFVVRELTSRELKRKYARSYLGVVWSVLNPLLLMIVMTMIFSYMFERSIDNFPVYYLTGSLFLTLYDHATTSAMNALVDNRNLLLKVKFPKQVFVLSRVYTAVVNFGYSLIAYAIVAIVLGVTPTWTILLFPVDAFFAALFALGVGHILAIIYVFFADVKYLYIVFLRLLLYSSALFYPVDRLPSYFQKVVAVNPVYIQILFARECIMWHHVPALSIWIRLIVSGVVMFFLGLYIFRKYENKVMQVL